MAATAIILAVVVGVLALLFVYVIPLLAGTDKAGQTQTAADAAALAGAVGARDRAVDEIDDAVWDLRIAALLGTRETWRFQDAATGGSGFGAAQQYAVRNDATLESYNHNANRDQVKADVRLDARGPENRIVRSSGTAQVGVELGSCEIVAKREITRLHRAAAGGDPDARADPADPVAHPDPDSAVRPAADLQRVGVHRRSATARTGSATRTRTSTSWSTARSRGWPTWSRASSRDRAGPVGRRPAHERSRGARQGDPRTVLRRECSPSTTMQRKVHRVTRHARSGAGPPARRPWCRDARVPWRGRRGRGPRRRARAGLRQQPLRREPVRPQLRKLTSAVLGGGSCPSPRRSGRPKTTSRRTSAWCRRTARTRAGPDGRRRPPGRRDVGHRGAG